MSGFPAICKRCSASDSEINATARTWRLFCRSQAVGMPTNGRELFEGTLPPAWCPLHVGRDDEPESRLEDVQALAAGVLGIQLCEGEMWIGEDAQGNAVVGVKYDDGNTTRLGCVGDRVRLWREVK